MHMKLDQARLRHRVVDVLITDLAKYFDVIAREIHPIVGAWVGLGEADHLATHTEAFSYTLPLGPWQSSTLAQLLGTPRGTIQGVHAGATAALPFMRFLDIAYRTHAVEPFRFPGLMWVDDTIVILERGDSRPIQGDPAGGCPRPQNPTRINIRPAAPALPNAGCDSPPSGQHVDDGHPGLAPGGASRGPPDTALQRPAVDGD